MTQGECEMEFNEVRDVIIEVLNCDAASVTPEARLREDLGADSLAAVELVMALEESCGVFAEDEHLDSLRTVNDILEYWKKLTEKQG